MKSPAHPEWPYTGTPHEWRGFVKDEKKPFCARANLHEILGNLRDEIAVYQKQNFGPELK